MGRNCLSVRVHLYIYYTVHAPTDAHAPSLFIDRHRGIPSSKITLFSSFLTPVALLRLLIVFFRGGGALGAMGWGEPAAFFFCSGHVKFEKNIHNSLTFWGQVIYLTAVQLLKFPMGICILFYM